MRDALLLGGLAAVALAGVWHRRWLTPGGVAAAAAVGGGVLAGAGAGGLVLLLLFFVTSSLLTGFRAAEKRDARARDRAGAGGGSGGGGGGVGNGPRGGGPRSPGRSARQVLANGGVAATASLLGLAGWLPGAHYALAGALAAATADTWATEVGTAGWWPTRRITDWRRVPPGTSGGVSGPGTAAGVAGALLLGLAAALLLPGGTGPGLVAVGLLAGTAGMLTDSAVGAGLEARWGWLDNDVVNLTGTVSGAAGACLLWWLGA